MHLFHCLDGNQSTGQYSIMGTNTRPSICAADAVTGAVNYPHLEIVLVDNHPTRTPHTNERPW
jgi:hypothetical protein